MSILAASAMSSKRAIWGVWGAVSLPQDQIRKDQYRNEAEYNALGLRRGVQAHFAKYHVHIPLEDIDAPLTRRGVGQEIDAPDKGFQRCSNRVVCVWVPLMFEIPGAGILTWEMRWVYTDLL